MPTVSTNQIDGNYTVPSLPDDIERRVATRFTELRDELVLLKGSPAGLLPLERYHEFRNFVKRAEAAKRIVRGHKTEDAKWIRNRFEKLRWEAFTLMAEMLDLHRASAATDAVDSLVAAPANTNNGTSSAETARRVHDWLLSGLCYAMEDIARVRGDLLRGRAPGHELRRAAQLLIEVDRLFPFALDSERSRLAMVEYNTLCREWHEMNDSLPAVAQ